MLNSISKDIIIVLLETHFDTVYVMHTLGSFYPDNVFNAMTEIHIPSIDSFGLSSFLESDISAIKTSCRIILKKLE